MQAGLKSATLAPNFKASRHGPKYGTHSKAKLGRGLPIRKARRRNQASPMGPWPPRLASQMGRFDDKIKNWPKRADPRTWKAHGARPRRHTENPKQMNSLLNQLKPYPFAKLAKLLENVEPGKPPISLGMGEPRHPMPPEVAKILNEKMDLFGKYPPTQGLPELREAIAHWAKRRYGYDLQPLKETLPVLGSREALFSFTQSVIDSAGAKPGEKPVVLCPNPFYQIYQGAAIMAGADLAYVPLEAPNYLPDWDSVEDSTWRRVKLVFVCTPGNPTGKVMDLASWKKLFELQDKWGFVIASDECYSEIHFEGRPSYGMLDALRDTGRDLDKKAAFNSLSKRSNVPGLRSGIVIGAADIIAGFLSYRTYHGSAMSLPIQHASIWLWGDEEHVKANRALYKEKFDLSYEIMKGTFDVELPDASFYYWLKVPGGDDEAFAKNLWASEGVKVLPGSYLGAVDKGTNPGKGHVRVAIVSTVEECKEAFGRMVDFAKRG